MWVDGRRGVRGAAGVRAMAIGALVALGCTACGSSDGGSSDDGGSGGAVSAGTGGGASCVAPACGGCSSCLDACLCRTGKLDDCIAACSTTSAGGAGGTAGSGGVGAGGSSGAGIGGAGGAGGVSGASGGTAGDGGGGTGGTGGTGATGGTGGAGGSGGAGAGGSLGAPGEPALPTPTSPCPDFREGTVAFNAAGVNRSALVHMDAAAAASLDGPVVFYWYGTGGQPTQAVSGLGQAGIDRIKAAGGIVVAPSHVNGGTFPWLQGQEQTYALVDEVIACADEKLGIDARRIHSLGFSAGALFTTQLGYARSSYLASVATYSGGGAGTFADPSNKFAAMIFHGGPGDMVVINFQNTSQDYYGTLTSNGHFALICNHGGGHVIPTAARPGVIDFFFEHPFGTSPEPWATVFPPSVPSYCQR